MLRPFDVKPKQRRDSLGNKIRGYWLKDLEGVFERYLPPSELGQVGQPNTDGAFSDSQSGTGNEPCPTSESPETRTTTELSHLSHSQGQEKDKQLSMDL